MAENDEPMIQTPADFGHFVLEKELGHGGMGGVYLARDKMLDRRVGIKVMLKSLGADPKFVERFQREAQAAARLNHPNIAQIYSFGQEQGMPYIAMELVPGGSLDKEMEANPGTLDVVYVMRVGQQVADALALAAESGLVHGDVKPENVLFDADGNAKLVDFGLAAMQGDSDEIWGTPYYISPEKVRRQKIDYRADIYSLGGTLYHVLTGVPPFDGPDPTAVVKARFDGPPKKPSELRPEIPPEVDAIIMRMLELEPSMRYPTYQSLLGDFKRYLAKAGPAKTTKTAGPKLKFKGIKPKVSLSASGAGNTAPVDGEVADLQPIEDLEGEEEETKSMGVGAMVGLVAGGVLLVLLLVGGGLWWYTSSTSSAKEQQAAKQITDKQNEAREKIGEAKKKLQGLYDGYHGDFLKAQVVVDEAVQKVKNAMPEDMKPAAEGIFTLPPTDELVKAIALTNTAPAVAAPLPAPATNAAEAVSAEKKEEAKADDKKAEGKTADAKKPDAKKGAEKKPDAKKEAAKKDADEGDKDAEAEKALEEAEAKAEGKSAKKPAKKKKPAADKKKKKAGSAEEEESAEEPASEEAKPDDEPKPADEAGAAEAAKPAQLPPSVNSAVKRYEGLWKDLCKCQEADIKLYLRMRKLHEKMRASEAMTAQDNETTEALAQLANEIVGEYNSLTREKWLVEAQTALKNIGKKAAGYSKEAVEKIESAIKKQAAEEAKKAAAEKAAAEKAASEERKKALVEEERAKAQEAFDELADDIKGINWKQCTRQLTRRQERMKTSEGKDAGESQLKKIAFMEGMQKHFIKHAKGFRFKGKRGNLLATVVEADDRSLTLQKMKYERGKYLPDAKTTHVSWEDFYALKDQERKYGDFKGQFLGYMNQFIQELVVRGRETTKISARERSEYMLGAALTLQHLYGDKPGVDKFVPELVKEAVNEKNDNEKRKGFGPHRKWAALWFPDVELPEAEDPVE